MTFNKKCQLDFFLVIGSELTKEERTCLHRNVRLAFPHLQTETIKNEQEVNYPAESFKYCTELMQGASETDGKSCYREVAYFKS